MGFLTEIKEAVFGKPPAPPAAPDYTGAAVAQGAANVETARASAKLSNPNVYSPYGTQLVSYEGDVPTIRQTLTPEAQRTLEAQQALQGNLARLGGTAYTNAFGTLSTPFSFGGQVQTQFNQGGALQNAPSAGQYGLAQGGPNAPTLNSQLDLSNIAKMPVNAGTTAQEAIMRRLEPSLARQRTSTETQLINQGLRPGTEAYDNAARILGEQENDLRSQAALQGLNLDIGANQQGFNQALQGGQYGNAAQLSQFGAAQQAQQAQNQAIAQNYGQGMTAAQAQNAIEAQRYNQAMQAAQFGNTAQQQALAQALTQRQLPLNEINALMSGSQIQNPQFGAYQGQTITPAPIANAAAQQGAFNQNLYNQQVGTYNTNVEGLYNLGGSAARASDIRLKSNIKRLGTHKSGLGIYEYDIFGRHEVGVMAQEALVLRPDVVLHHPAGFLMVDYGRL
ncbi:MAG: tail fiber domain-containing protein [Burkholderiaceae bacterium]|nr:tail fiber domain-containing protein [Burkholderiaceae bacterium]